MNAPPILCTWDGESMVPQPRFAQTCDKQFCIGETYRLDVGNDRSGATHSHYFATVSDAWSHLPEHLAGQFPTPEHLRKFALIRAGYRDERTIVASSKAEAQRLAAFIKPMDEFAVIVVSAATVTVYTAKSQSYRAMGGREFNASKQRVLDEISRMIGVSTDELARNAGRAA